jgi:CheY-like chemotaxis protein
VTSRQPLVLIIDDEVSVRDLIQRHLLRENFRVEMASDGERGLQMARSLRPDVITLDVLMPKMDGWSVLSALKNDPELSEIPIIMMTITDNKQMGFALGASDYLTKPIDRRQLTSLLQKYTGMAVPSNSHVLVVEDDANNRDMLVRLLQKGGWKNITEAENGRVGLEKMVQTTPDLILLDLMMPEVDGFQFLATMRQNPKWQSLPVIVVTAKVLSEGERAILNGTVEKVLQKGSYQLDDLLQEVLKLAVKHSTP